MEQVKALERVTGHVADINLVFPLKLWLKHLQGDIVLRKKTLFLALPSFHYPNHTHVDRTSLGSFVS